MPLRRTSLHPTPLHPTSSRLPSLYPTPPHVTLSTDPTALHPTPRCPTSPHPTLPPSTHPNSPCPTSSHLFHRTPLHPPHFTPPHFSPFHLTSLHLNLPHITPPPPLPTYRLHKTWHILACRMPAPLLEACIASLRSPHSTSSHPYPSPPHALLCEEMVGLMQDGWSALGAPSSAFSKHNTPMAPTPPLTPHPTPTLTHSFVKKGLGSCLPAGCLICLRSAFQHFQQT